MAKKVAKKSRKPATKKQNKPAKPMYDNCYPLAATTFLGLVGEKCWKNILGPWLEEQGIEPRNAELVHGFPYQPIEAGGKRIGHAWVECRNRGKTIVINLGNGRKIAPTLHQPSVYYSVGRIDRKDCQRYKTAREVLMSMNESGFWGPWGAVPEDVVIPGLQRAAETRKKRKG